MKRFAGRLLLLLLCVLLSIGITCWLHTDSGRAAAFRVEKLTWRVMGLINETDPSTAGRDDVISIRIEDAADFDLAKKFMPELLIPGYVPEGWELESLVLMKTLSGCQ